MKKPLWTPGEAWTRNANISRFIEKVNQKHGKDFKTYGPNGDSHSNGDSH